MASVTSQPINQVKSQQNVEQSYCSTITNLVVTWVPRIGIAGYVGTYALGWAYVWGVMATIDRIAIATLMWLGGPVGGIGLVGYYMPMFQPFAVWLVRGVFIAAAEALYHLVEKVVIYVYNCVKERSNPQP